MEWLDLLRILEIFSPATTDKRHLIVHSFCQNRDHQDGKEGCLCWSNSKKDRASVGLLCKDSALKLGSILGMWFSLTSLQHFYNLRMKGSFVSLPLSAVSCVVRKLITSPMGSPMTTGLWHQTVVLITGGFPPLLSNTILGIIFLPLPRPCKDLLRE